MNELINVNYEGEKATVLGRDLHKFLEIGTEYHIWFPRMLEYGFLEGTDYIAIAQKRTIGIGKGLTDHQITLDMAKEISMIQRNEKGKQARQYFIECEKQLKAQAPQTYIEALRQLLAAEEEKQKLLNDNTIKDQIIKEYEPKATYYDLILQSKEAIPITKIAKDYGYSAITFNKLLHELQIQYNISGTWILYQTYADKGYTKTKTHYFIRSSGLEDSKINTYWTQKGRLFLYDILKNNNHFPLIEWKDDK